MAMPIPNRIQTQLRLDKTLHAKLKVIAEHENRPLNAQVEYYCKVMVEEYERKHGAVKVED